MKIFNKIKTNKRLTQQLTLKDQTGMTLIELIVVLAIFAVLSTVVVFDYGDFQSKIDIKNLANDVALQVVQAQSSALSGLRNSSASASWKPTYGVYFNPSGTTDSNGADNKDFIYFADLNNNNQFDGSAVGTGCTGDCLSKYTVTQNNYISNITVYYTNGTNDPSPSNVTITFTRPNSGATIYDGVTNVTNTTSYVQVTVKNQKGNISSSISLYPSGRIQIN